MSIEENAKQLCSILMPMCLVLTPICLLVEVYAFLIDPKASEVKVGNLIFFNVMIFGGFFLALWYCRVYMGWFRKKDK